MQPQMPWSQVISKLDIGTVKSILDGVTLGMTEGADTQDPVVAKAGDEIHKPVQETVRLAQAAHVNLHVIDWGDHANRRIQYSRPQLSGSLARKYRI